MPVLAVPDPDLVGRGSGEYVGEAEREGNVINALVVAGVPELGCEVGGVDPVDVGLRGSAEEVSVVSSEGNRCNVSHQFALVLDLHGLDRDPSQLTLTSSNHQIPVRQYPNGRYAETKESFDWSNSLVDGFFDVDLEDVSGLGAAVDVRIVVVDGCVGELALDVAEVGVEGLDLLVDLVDSQDLDAVVLHGDESAAVVIEEEDLVDGLLVGRAVEALAALHVPNDQHVPASADSYLSSRQPWEARRRESGEKARLLTECLCSLKRCLISLLSKSQTSTSATCPGREL